MTEIHDFEPDFIAALPETAELLKAAPLVVHPRVTCITVHGSRGPAGGYRPDSDVDLSLIVDTEGVTERAELETLLRDVLDTTLTHWTSDVEADLAAIFDIRGCGLHCFDCSTYDEDRCGEESADCFGLYKVQKGFDGFVEGLGIEVEAMYPCAVVWRRG
jgi:predicted nucleotidyltransferase